MMVTPSFSTFTYFVAADAFSASTTQQNNMGLINSIQIALYPRAQHPRGR